MGGNHKFGKLAYVRNQVWYTLSPNELKPFAGYFSKGFPNLVRRIVQEAPYMLPPFLLGYGLFAWTKNQAYLLGRKPPVASEDAKPAH
jgi:hypothetical protein